MVVLYQFWVNICSECWLQHLQCNAMYRHGGVKPVCLLKHWILFAEFAHNGLVQDMQLYGDRL